MFDLKQNVSFEQPLRQKAARARWALVVVSTDYYFCRECDNLTSLRGSALRHGSVENAQCGCAVWNPGRCPYRPAGCGSGSEMRSSTLAGCVGDSRPLVEVMLAGSAAGLCPFDRCRDVRSQTMLLLSGSSPTILLLLVADKLLLVVAELAVRCWCSGTDWAFLVCRAA